MTIEQYQPRAEMALASVQDAAVHRLGEWAQSADAAYAVAERLSQSSFVPAQYRGKPVELTAAILAGIEVGLSPMAAMRSFDMIQGVSAPRAITLRAVVQAHGHELVLVESTATRCRMRGKRKGSDEWQTVSWTIERARDLGLTGKDNWKKQPAAMLMARATSELARLIASDAILGIGYSSEEVADGSNYDAPANGTSEQSSGSRKMSRPKPPENSNSEGGRESEHQDAGDPHARPPEPESDWLPITSAQVTKIAVCMKEAGITDRADALKYVNDVLPEGREVGSRKELTKDEASRVIEALEADLAQPFPDVTDAELVEES